MLRKRLLTFGGPMGLDLQFHCPACFPCLGTQDIIVGARIAQTWVFNLKVSFSCLEDPLALEPPWCHYFSIPFPQNLQRSVSVNDTRKKRCRAFLHLNFYPLRISFQVSSTRVRVICARIQTKVVVSSCIGLEYQMQISDCWKEHLYTCIKHTISSTFVLEKENNEHKSIKMRM